MRRKDREIIEQGEILKIIDRAKILHLGLMDEDYPYIVPLHYGYEYDNINNSIIFYMHGAKEGYKLVLIQKSPNVCVELETDIELISGGDIPCKYGSAYASVIGRGKAEVVDNIDEKIHALTLLMINQTGNKFEINEKMVDTVAIMKVTVNNLSAKSRQRPN